MDSILTTEMTVNLILLISSIGLLISTLEDLHNFHVFEAQGLLSWTIIRYSKKSMHTHPFWLALSFMFKESIFKAFLWARWLACLVLILDVMLDLGPVAIKPISVTIVFMVTLLLNFRTVYGQDGAHQMNLIIYLALFCYFILPQGSFGSVFCVLFIAVQSIVSYVISGIFKLKGESWRKGQAIYGIMSTRIYGNRKPGYFLEKRPWLGLLGCWFVISFESLFFLTAFGNGLIMLLFLGLGVLFHLLNAYLMGLNGFFYAFTATYPAILFLNQFLQSL